jgi:DNA-binding NarL/FixJ family response regulator
VFLLGLFYVAAGLQPAVLQHYCGLKTRSYTIFKLSIFMCKKLEDFAAYDRLLPNEKQLFDLLISGKTNPEIAKDLCMSNSKLEAKITDFYKKIDFLADEDNKIKDKKTVLMAKVIQFLRGKL